MEAQQVVVAETKSDEASLPPSSPNEPSGCNSSKPNNADAIIGIKKSWIIETLKLQKKLLEASRVQKKQLERLQILTKESQKSCRRDKITIKKLCDMNKALIRRNKILDKRNSMLIKLKLKR